MLQVEVSSQETRGRKKRAAREVDRPGSRMNKMSEYVFVVANGMPMALLVENSRRVIKWFHVSMK